MSTDITAPATAPETLDRGTYEILQERLREQAEALKQRANRLNEKRLELFGSSEMSVIGNERIRTENNCVPCDIRPAGRYLLFGYNVFIGLKTETQVEDVLSLHSFEERDGGFSFHPLGEGNESHFLSDRNFVRDFKELYKFYKETRLLQLRRVAGKLLAIFQTGKALTDIKVFRWAEDPQGGMTYIDSRGERDHVFPPSHDFEWVTTDRDQHVSGRHPHVNILDQVFVETVGGDLTVKVEDNTEDGRGIYRELVEETDQSLDDADILYAQVGPLILLKIKPYNEQDWRYLVFNTRTQSVSRIDAIGQACLLLPEDHGLIFPGGYYLQSGDTKTFDSSVDIGEMEFLKSLRSPNGEDVLYIFHERQQGRSVLLSYNMIRKEVQNPIICHGYSFFQDGRLVIFRSISEEPTRVHPMQIWQTPYMSDEHAAEMPSQGSFLEKVGNADLVRGISDGFSICRMIGDQEPSVAIYEDLIAATVKTQDSYHWLGAEEVGDLASSLAEIRATGELIVDEFEKVQQIRQQARKAVEGAAAEFEQLLQDLRRSERDTVPEFVEALSKLRHQRGHLVTLREMRYVDLQRLDALEQQMVAEFEELSGQMVNFLQGDQALQPYHKKIDELIKVAEGTEKASILEPLRESYEEIGSGLELLNEVVGGLDIDDATIRINIAQGISEVLALLNRGRALLEVRYRELLEVEGTAEFGAQFALFGLSVSGAWGLVDSPEKCDEQLSKLMLQLEELESRFGEFDLFVEQLATKREDVYEAFSSRKQTLVDERQRRVERLVGAADRILKGVVRRASGLGSADELNTYFVGDAMVAKIRDLAGQLREIQAGVQADELESRLKSAREDANRILRDRQDMFEDGADLIKLGRHRFSVNTRPFELTLVPRSEVLRGEQGKKVMTLHLTGTDFYQPLVDPELEDTREFWDQLLVSETSLVYRGEYLAASILFAAEVGEDEVNLRLLQEAAAENNLLEVVRKYASERYEEGYERGLHDHDGALILGQLVELYRSSGLLRFAPKVRAAACLFWAFGAPKTQGASWQRRAASLGRLRSVLGPSPAIGELARELASAAEEFFSQGGPVISAAETQMVGAYLFEELAVEDLRFITSGAAIELQETFLEHLRLGNEQQQFEEDLRRLENLFHARYHLVEAWLQTFLEHGQDSNLERLAPFVGEAVALVLVDQRLPRQVSNATTTVEVAGLLGQHRRIQERKIELRLDEFLTRLTDFRHHAQGFRRFQKLRHELLERHRHALRLDEFIPKVMSAFVRNRLISEVYLPLIGDNLAKQMGASGMGKRTDQMGLLLLISPPGYGKTTLMEYVANRLGLIFVKVNGPSLGHGVRSIDPAEAPNATARQEVEKINFALETGNNVLLYLDDIQHTHPELLQKFISLCDAQRRMEGVWRGKTRTVDLKNKRFAVCMAGNPYTEAGEKFQIPDMLANRADTYNLGDILEGKDHLFALSYIENSLTSNPILAPLTTREPQDVYRLVGMAQHDKTQGDGIQADQLDHGYSAVELEEILAVMRRLIQVQQLLLKVNLEYIRSASQDDAFRTEPRFQLQGSYRNMNKLAEKIVPVMNDAELAALIDDHYAGEAQTLTSGAEHNQLKLAELRGTLTETQKARWEEIKRGFARVQAMGGAEDDPATRLVGQLGLMSDRLQEIGAVIRQAGEDSTERQTEENAAASEVDWETTLQRAFKPYLGNLQQILTTVTDLEQEATRRQQSAEDQPAKGDGPKMLAQTLERVGQETAEGMTGVVIQLQQINAALDDAFEGLDQTLQTLAAAPRGGEIVQALGPGVYDLLTRLAKTVDANLMPLVKGLGAPLKESGTEQKKLTIHLNRTLQNLDMMKDLVTSLRKIDTRDLS